MDLQIQTLKIHIADSICRTFFKRFVSWIQFERPKISKDLIQKDLCSIPASLKIIPSSLWNFCKRLPYPHLEWHFKRKFWIFLTKYDNFSESFDLFGPKITFFRKNFETSWDSHKYEINFIKNLTHSPNGGEGKFQKGEGGRPVLKFSLPHTLPPRFLASF